MRLALRFAAQAYQQLRDGNPDRAHFAARAAQRGHRGQQVGLFQSHHVRRHDLADRPRVGGAVGQAADAGVHRAVVHARTAADALQRLAQLLVGIGLAAAVVEQDQVHLFGAVLLARLARAGDHVEVGRDRLAGGRARQDGVQRRNVLQLLDHLLDAGDRHVHPRHGGAHAAVAFVLHQAQRAGLGDSEIHARQADVGLLELLAQHLAADLDQGVDIVGVGDAGNLLGEQGGDLLLGLVDRRHDDVRRLLARQLDDVFAHVGFQRVDPCVVHRVVELDLLAHHRLALDDGLRRMAAGDAEHDRVGFVRIGRPMHLHAVARQVGLELFEQVGQPGQAVLADAFGQRAQRVEFRFIGELCGTLGHQEVHRAAEALAQMRVVDRIVHALAQRLRGDEGDRAGVAPVRRRCG